MSVFWISDVHPQLKYFNIYRLTMMMVLRYRDRNLSYSLSHFCREELASLILRHASDTLRWMHMFPFNASTLLDVRVQIAFGYIAVK